MRTAKSYSITIALVLLVLPLIAGAQQRDSTRYDSAVIYRVITPTFLRDSIAIEIQVCNKLAREYIKALNSINPDEFQHIQLAAKLKNFYATDTGIKLVLRTWVVQTATKKPTVPTVKAIITSMIVDGSQDSLTRGFTDDVENKYATVVVVCKDRSKDYDIYLNSDRLCALSEAKNGVVVQSQKAYKIELRYEDAIVCQWEVKLKGREKKTIQCNGR